MAPLGRFPLDPSLAHTHPVVIASRASRSPLILMLPWPGGRRLPRVGRVKRPSCTGQDPVTRCFTRSPFILDPSPLGSSPEWRMKMPLIQVKLIEEVFTDSQKREIIEKLTDTMVEIEGENMRPVTWVVVEEVKSGQWGIGGNPLTTADVKALAAGVPVG
jgi:4-oxalocrotonate tautomerase